MTTTSNVYITYPSTTTGTGYTYQTTGTGINYGPNIGTYTIANDPNLKGTSLKVHGDADFDGNITVKGKSINESLERIEERLAILYPNEELEKKWEKLRGLRKAYMELEQEIIEKEKMWNILKK